MRAFQHFDTLNGVCVQISEVVAATGAGRIVYGYAVDQHQCLVIGSTAYTHAGVAAKGAVLVDRDTGRGCNSVQGKVDAQLFQVVPRDDGDT